MKSVANEGWAEQVYTFKPRKTHGVRETESTLRVAVVLQTSSVIFWWKTCSFYNNVGCGLLLNLPWKLYNCNGGAQPSVDQRIQRRDTLSRKKRSALHRLKSTRKLASKPRPMYIKCWGTNWLCFNLVYATASMDLIASTASLTASEFEGTGAMNNGNTPVACFIIISRLLCA